MFGLTRTLPLWRLILILAALATGMRGAVAQGYMLAPTETGIAIQICSADGNRTLILDPLTGKLNPPAEPDQPHDTDDPAHWTCPFALVTAVLLEAPESTYGSPTYARPQLHLPPARAPPGDAARPPLPARGPPLI